MRDEDKTRLVAIAFLFLGFLGFNFVYPDAWNGLADDLNRAKNSSGILRSWEFQHFPSPEFKLGLDLQGGVTLLYQADLSQISAGEEKEAMAGVRDVIERRVNVLGVAEPVVQVIRTQDAWRLLVELAGIEDVQQATSLIGETPQLDFREVKSDEDFSSLDSENPDEIFVRTELDGRRLRSARVDFDNISGAPYVALSFDKEGGELFDEITRRNVGRPLAIYLDGKPISIPVVRQEITGGQAIIEGSFSVAEAQQLARRLNAGALPVPITLISQQQIGPSLGAESLQTSLEAGILGLGLLAVFLIGYYRLAGLLAILGLITYAIIVLSIFKLIPVTLTLSGIAGLILSLGMAVDANILIFERLREALRRGVRLDDAVREGYLQAWPAIRDGNISTLLTAGILFLLGAGFVQGFALTLSIGILTSMLTALVFLKSVMLLVADTRIKNVVKLLLPAK